MFPFFADVNLLESFNLKDGVNGVQQTSASRFDNGFYFAKTHKDVIAVPEVLEEIIDLLGTYKTFIVQFHIQTEPFHKGTILWIEQKSTGEPLHFSPGQRFVRNRNSVTELHDSKLKYGEVII